MFLPLSLSASRSLCSTLFLSYSLPRPDACLWLQHDYCVDETNYIVQNCRKARKKEAGNEQGDSIPLSFSLCWNTDVTGHLIYEPDQRLHKQLTAGSTGNGKSLLETGKWIYLLAKAGDRERGLFPHVPLISIPPLPLCPCHVHFHFICIRWWRR